MNKAKVGERVAFATDRFLYIERHGDGPPLLFLHGYSQSSKAWEDFVDDFPSREVVLIDLPGHGRSSPFADGFSAAEARDAVIEACEVLGFSAIDAVGFSFGADVLFQIASCQPGLVNAAIAISSTGSWRASDYPDLGHSFTSDNVDITALHPDPETVAAIFRAFPDYDVSLSNEAVAAIQAHFFLMVGDRDPVTPLTAVIDIYQRLSRSSLWVAPNTDHGVHQGRERAQFTRRAHRFLAKVGLS